MLKKMKEKVLGKEAEIKVKKTLTGYKYIYTCDICRTEYEKKTLTPKLDGGKKLMGQFYVQCPQCERNVCKDKCWNFTMGTCGACNTINLQNAKEKERRERFKNMTAKIDAAVKSKSKSEGKIIFVSYATADAPMFKIAEIAEALTKKKDIADVLYWQEDMSDNIVKFMSDNLAECDAVVMFCSQNYLNSGPCNEEWTTAKMINKPLIPVFKDPEDIPTLVKTSLGHSFDENNLNKNVEEIYQLIEKKTAPDE